MNIQQPKPKIPFNIARLEHLWCVGGYSQVDVKHTPYGGFIVHFTQKLIYQFDIEFCERKIFIINSAHFRTNNLNTLLYLSSYVKIYSIKYWEVSV